MKTRATSEAHTRTAQAPPELRLPAMPIAEDLARREKTPFIMTRAGRRGKNTLGMEAGQTLYSRPENPA